MNRHHFKTRMAERMAKRRARITRQDALARHFRSMPYLMAGMQALSVTHKIRSTTANTVEMKAIKALTMADVAIEMCKLGTKAVKIRNTPTEIMDRL